MKRTSLGLLSTLLLMVMFTLGVYSKADDTIRAITALSSGIAL